MNLEGILGVGASISIVLGITLYLISILWTQINRRYIPMQDDYDVADMTVYIIKTPAIRMIVCGIIILSVLIAMRT